MSSKGESDIETLIASYKILWPNFKITVQQIRQPTSDFVFDLLERFMEHIGQDCEEHFRKANKEIDKELCAGLLPAAIYCNVLKLSLSNMDIPLTNQLTPGMLLNPTMKFTLVLLKYVQNYVIYFTKCAKKFNGINLSYQNISTLNEEMKHSEENIRMRRNNLAINRSKFQKYRLEHEKNIEEMKHLLKENQEKKKTMENTVSTLESEKKMVRKDVQPKLESYAKLENSIKNTRHLISLKDDSLKLEREITNLKNEDEFLTTTLKTKKFYETDVSIKKECDLFSETNDQCYSSYETIEKLEAEIKNLKQKLKKVTIQAKNSQINDKNFEIQKLEKKITLLEENLQNRQQDSIQEKEKIQTDINEIIKQFNEVDNANASQLQVELANILSKNDKLIYKDKKFRECCSENYQKVLNQEIATNETFTLVTANARNRLN